jgi:hypothetical protein
MGQDNGVAVRPVETKRGRERVNEIRHDPL